jgi:hypothetical protein
VTKETVDNQIFALIQLPYFEYILYFIVAVIAVFFIYKWKIYFLIKNRILMFILGKKYSEFSNTNLQRFHKRNIDIFHFNTLYGVSATSYEQIKKYQKWLHRNGVAASQIIKIKPHFNIKTLSYPKITLWKIFCNFIVLLILFIVFLMCTNFSFTSSALIKVEKNEPWFWVSNNYAKNSQYAFIPFTNSTWYLNASMCNETGFDEKKWAEHHKVSFTTTKIICEHFNSEESQKKISKIVNEQKAFFIPITLGICFTLFYVLVRIFKLALVFDIRMQIKWHRTKKWKRKGRKKP